MKVPKAKVNSLSCNTINGECFDINTSMLNFQITSKFIMYIIGNPKWWLLAISIATILGMLLMTFIFCFWSIYLLEAIQRKWRYHKNELRCIKLGDYSLQQRIFVYNSKTEYIKLIFLFFINLLEWLGLISLAFQ